MDVVEEREKERLAHLRSIMEEQAMEDKERWVPRRSLWDKMIKYKSS